MTTTTQEKTRSIYVHGRLWFDKVNGNTYYSTSIQVNGKVIHTIPMSYGYDLQYLTDSLKWLKDNGYINSTKMWELRDEQGIDVYFSENYGKKSEMYRA